MATLIAANYQSESSTAYGFMPTWNIKLKNNTLYTVRCRYKWDKNGTASTCPYAFYLWRSTWTNSYVITNVYNDYTTYVGTFTTPSDASSYSWNIHCYANANHNAGVSDGAILSVDWYELWEGDATTFSLTDAIALSENKSANNFLTIQNGCTNTGYFSTTEPKNALRSWMGYYYKTGQTTSYGDWTYTYNHYSSASRSRSAYTYDVYKNGKKVHVGTSTQTEYATVTYTDWSYNWTVTDESTRSRTVTYSWSDYSSTATQTETGGTRYLVLSEETSTGDGLGKIAHTFAANGSGSKTFTTQVHNYWGSTYINCVAITGVSCSCSGFTCSVSGSTLTVTASNLGTTEKAYHKATIVSSKSGFVTRSGYTCIAQEANVRSLSSVYFIPYKPDASWIVDVSNGQWSTCPASGGYVKANGYANYTHTSGSPLNDQHITTDASLTWSTGKDSWITNHSSGGYYIHSRGTTSGDAHSSNATWSYGGKTSGAKTLTQAHNNPQTVTEYSVDSVSPTSKSVAATSGSFTFSWRQLKRTRYYSWPSGASDTYSSWVPETYANPSSISSNADWATISGQKTSDSLGNNSVTVSYTSNSSTSSTRSATITVTNGGGSGSVYFEQAADYVTSTSNEYRNYYLNVEYDGYSMGDAGGTCTFNSAYYGYETREKYTWASGRATYSTWTAGGYSVGASSLSVSGSGTGFSINSSNRNVTTSENTDTNQRSCTYTYSYGSASKSLIFYQDGKPLETSIIAYAENNYNTDVYMIISASVNITYADSTAAYADLEASGTIPGYGGGADMGGVSLYRPEPEWYGPMSATVDLYGDLQNSLDEYKFQGCYMCVEVVDSDGYVLQSSMETQISNDYNPLGYDVQSYSFDLDYNIPFPLGASIRLKFRLQD